MTGSLQRRKARCVVWKFHPQFVARNYQQEEVRKQFAVGKSQLLILQDDEDFIGKTSKPRSQPGAPSFSGDTPGFATRLVESPKQPTRIQLRFFIIALCDYAIVPTATDTFKEEKNAYLNLKQNK